DAMRKKIALLELREKRFAQTRYYDNTDHHHQSSQSKDRSRATDNAEQQRFVNAMKPTHEDRLAMFDRRVAEGDVAQGWCNRECNDHRGHHGQTVGNGQRLEESARQTSDKENRNQHHDIDQRRVNDGLADFERSFKDDSGGRFLNAFLAAFAESADD